MSPGEGVRSFKPLPRSNLRSPVQPSSLVAGLVKGRARQPCPSTHPGPDVRPADRRLRDADQAVLVDDRSPDARRRVVRVRRPPGPSRLGRGRVELPERARSPFKAKKRLVWKGRDHPAGGGAAGGRPLQAHPASVRQHQPSPATPAPRSTTTAFDSTPAPTTPPTARTWFTSSTSDRRHSLWIDLQQRQLRPVRLPGATKELTDVPLGADDFQFPNQVERTVAAHDRRCLPATLILELAADTSGG